MERSHQSPFDLPSTRSSSAGRAWSILLLLSLADPKPTALGMLCSFPGLFSSHGSWCYRCPRPEGAVWQLQLLEGDGGRCLRAQEIPFSTTAKWDTSKGQHKQPPGKAQPASGLLLWHSPSQPHCALLRGGRAGPAPSECPPKDVTQRPRGAQKTLALPPFPGALRGDATPAQNLSCTGTCPVPRAANTGPEGRS